MPTKPLHLCAHPGCSNLTDGRYCPEHIEDGVPADTLRGTAADRGYDYQWRKFRDWYLSRPENRFCRLHISQGCTIVADCIDHIVPLELGGAKYDPDNLQPSCLRCNTAKGRRIIRGTWTFGQSDK